MDKDDDKELEGLVRKCVVEGPIFEEKEDVVKDNGGWTLAEEVEGNVGWDDKEGEDEDEGCNQENVPGGG